MAPVEHIPGRSTLNAMRSQSCHHLVVDAELGAGHRLPVFDRRAAKASTWEPLAVSSGPRAGELGELLRSIIP